MVAFALPLLDLLSALRVGETKFDMSEIMLEEHGDVRPLLGDIRLEFTEDIAELGEDRNDEFGEMLVPLSRIVHLDFI